MILIKYELDFYIGERLTRYKIADVVFDAEFNYEYTADICRDYLYDGVDLPSFSVKITQADIDEEKVGEACKFPDYYLESLAVFRKLCEYLLESGEGIIFHSSAVMVDGEAYLFAAPSGTGKSTHTGLWRKLLGDRAVMINDDKPIIKRIDGDFYVYGTPWMGKHHLGNNIRCKIKAVCKLERGAENSIKKIGKDEMLMTLLNQTLRPEKEETYDKLLKILEDMLNTVGLYGLKCNMDISAAELSYNSMSKGE